MINSLSETVLATLIRIQCPVRAQNEWDAMPHAGFPTGERVIPEEAMGMEDIGIPEVFL